MFRFVVLALAVCAATATPGYLGGSVASPVLATQSLGYGGLAAPLASSYAYNGLGLRTGLVGSPYAGSLGVAPYGAPLAGSLGVAPYGAPLAGSLGVAPLAGNYGYGLASPLGLRSAVSPLGYGAPLAVRAASPYGLAAPLGVGYGPAAYGVGAYGLGGALIH